MKLYYEQTAKDWTESLPIGNGSLGAMILGNPVQETIGINQESIWSGYYKDKNHSSAYEYLEKVRTLIINSQFEEAEHEIEKHMLGEFGESYLPFGNLLIKTGICDESKIKNYRRTLDLDNAVVTILFEYEARVYKYEYFASYPHDAIFLRYTCSEAAMDINIEFESQLQCEIEKSSNGIIIKGQCPEHVDPNYIKNHEHPIIQGTRGMEFAGKIELVSTDGQVKSNGDIQAACEAIYKVSVIRLPRKVNVEYDEIKRQHIKDYQSIYKKVELYLGEQLELPTDIRLERLKHGAQDNGLYGLYFQYGRYLLISSSRKGSLPANLQGIWSWELRAPWSSNWTININLPMNYWPVHSCNLTECFEPFVSFMQDICEEGKKTAKTNYRCRGFVLHHNADYWKNTSPVGIAYGEQQGESPSVSYSMWPMGGAWLVSELFKYYEYNLDQTYLREKVYPILKECTLFLLDWVVEYNGRYITCPSTSPENQFLTEDGVAVSVAMSSAMDLAIIREIFYDFQKTCDVLRVQDETLAEIESVLEKLDDFKIGSFGQILEWDKEYREVELGHRHLSHLYGLFPSEVFANRPELIEASRISLLHRLEHGGGHTGWSCAWIINLFAILKDSENAYKYLKNLLVKSTYTNLWDAHPPFQIDGNFGGIAGIANMLVQDRNDEVVLLPALPEEFSDGFVKGLRIKNNKIVDITWKNGKVIESKIYSCGN